MASERIRIANFSDVGPLEPLKGVEEAHIRKFHERNDLPIEEEIFVRGVLAFRHQKQLLGVFEDTSANVGIDMKIGDHQYTKQETEVIRKAWTRNRLETFRNLARLHRLLIVACIYAAMTQGWDQASMAGAAIEVMQDLGRPTSAGPSFIPTQRADEPDFSIELDYNTWLLGVTVGVPFFAGAVLGLIVTDPVTSILGFGRRGAICVAAIFSFLSVIGSASVNKWEHLLGFRILLGAGMAGKASIVPILLSETSPKNIRGMLLVFWQLFVAFGLAAGSVANLSVYSLNTTSSWRYMFISAFIPALLLLSLILFSPESPRWLLKESGARNNGEPDDASRIALVQQAFQSLIDLRGEPSSILAAGELYLLHWRLVDEQRRLRRALSGEKPLEDEDAPHNEPPTDDSFLDVVDHIGWWPRMKLMFYHIGFVRRAHLAAFAVMVSQQLCGINLIAFLADTFFRYSIFHNNHDHNNHETSPAQNIQLLGFSLGLMLLNFLATIPALFIMDRGNGRRRALNWSFPCMAVSLLASALLSTSAGDTDRQPSVAKIVGHYVFLATFILAYSIGEGPAAFVISAEVFPLVNRELGMSFAVFWNFMGAGLLAVASPWLLKKLDQFGVLLLFAGLNMVAWFLCFWLVPPTAKEDLEDVYKSLGVPLDYMLVYLVRVIVWNTVTMVDFCLRLLIIPWRGFATWSVCAKRFGLQVKDPVEEYADHLERKKKEDGTHNTSHLSGSEIPLENLQTGRLVP